ncbi:hypothetical protein BKA70DRAFT_1513932 [Coprinopsis sp. MPI-PUGE-AT-0042]|nr:hypothetical protein BKA70DRAFT_1513932 [Coprinopsis sp. MPI-PUGE-AT-0042]
MFSRIDAEEGGWSDEEIADLLGEGAASGQSWSTEASCGWPASKKPAPARVFLLPLSLPILHAGCLEAIYNTRFRRQESRILPVFLTPFTPLSLVFLHMSPMATPYGQNRCEKSLVELPGGSNTGKIPSPKNQAQDSIDKRDSAVESATSSPFFLLDHEAELLADAEPIGFATSPSLLERSIDSKTSIVIVQHSPPFAIITPPDSSPGLNTNNTNLRGTVEAESKSSIQNSSAEAAKEKRGLLGFLMRRKAKGKAPEVPSPPAPSSTLSHPPCATPPRPNLPFFVFPWEIPGPSSQDLPTSIIPSSTASKDLQPSVHPGHLEAAMTTTLLLQDSPPELFRPLPSLQNRPQVYGDMEKPPASTVCKEPIMLVIDERFPRASSTDGIYESPPRAVMPTPPDTSPPYRCSPLHTSPQMLVFNLPQSWPLSSPGMTSLPLAGIGN